MLQGKIGNGVTGTGGTSAGDNGIGLHGTPCPDADACKKKELTLEHQTRTCGSPHPSEHPASLTASLAQPNHLVLSLQRQGGFG